MTPPAAGTTRQPIVPHTGVRRRRGRAPARIGLNLTAMIDVVFLLLVYFMAATEFKLGEEIYRLDLPERSAAADPFELPRDPLRIGIASTGPGAYAIRLSGAAPQPDSFEALHEFLVANRRTPGTLGGLFEPDHPIVVEPTGPTRWEHAMEAFSAAARARYTNITFAKPG